MSEKRGRTLYLTCIKIFAMLLVMYGHFISVGTWALEVAGVIDGTMSEPLLPSTEQNLWGMEVKMIGLFNIQFAVVGVVLFFLVSGYFIPTLQHRYNKSYLDKQINFPSLLFSRLSKYYPMMFVCVAINGLLAYLAQGILYSPTDYIATALLLNRVIPAETTMGVVWYLLVLIFSYAIATVVPKLTVTNLNQVYLFLFACVLLPHLLGSTPVAWIAWNLEYLSRYAGIVFLGCYAALSRNFTSRVYRVFGFAWYFILTVLLQKMDEGIYQITTTYSEINTYWAAFIIIAVFYGVFRLLQDHLSGVVTKALYAIEKVSFAFYLVHVHFGMTTMYYLKQWGVNAYLSVLCACVISAIVAIAVTWLVDRIEQTTWYKKIGVDWIS